VDATVREELEANVRALFDREDFDGAATVALKGYGVEIYSVLVAILRDRTAADDAFSIFSERLWRGLRDFEWACSVRTWAYAIARNAAFRHQRDSQRRARRAVPASDSALERIVAKVRTETLSFLRTERKSRLRALRDSLPPDDQLLVVLRVDRGLAWNDLARVMSSEEELGPEDLARTAARLRKRYQLVKERLLDAARREGLLREDG
jgi:RNA polymerase sigma-70 factor, ECF subfamily